MQTFHVLFYYLLILNISFAQISFYLFNYLRFGNRITHELAEGVMKLVILGVLIFFSCVAYLTFESVQETSISHIDHKVIHSGSNQSSNSSSINLKSSEVKISDDHLLREAIQLRDENASLRLELDKLRKQLSKEERLREHASVSTERFTFDREGEAVFLFDVLAVFVT